MPGIGTPLRRRQQLLARLGPRVLFVERLQLGRPASSTSTIHTAHEARQTQTRSSGNAEDKCGWSIKLYRPDLLAPSTPDPHGMRTEKPPYQQIDRSR
jgi:hypothetical protein